MKVTMLLADFAEVVNGKLYIMGGGWSMTGPEPAPTAVAIKIEAPWDAANQKHILKLELLDGNRKPVLVPTMDGNTAAVAMAASFEAGRAPGILPGSPLDVPFAVNVPPIPLTPGQRYIWKLTIDDEARDEWQATFTTRIAEAKVPTAA
jgi:hypothetical protein